MKTKGRLYTLLALSILLLAGVFYKNSPISSHPEKHVQGISTNGGVVTVTQSPNTVVTVTDGDTLTLSSGEKIRLLGINAPETGQPFSAEAKSKLEDIVLGKNVTVMYDIQKEDMYGRSLAYLYIDNLFVNKEMVRAGYAVIETIPPNIVHADELLSAQKESREKCNGLWGGLCKQTETACVQIANINPKGETKNEEWVELINTCSEQMNLKGYLIKDSSAGNSYTFKEFVISSKGKVKVHSGCGVDSKSDVYWKCPEKSNFIWNNTGDSVYLFDHSERLISSVSY